MEINPPKKNSHFYPDDAALDRYIAGDASAPEREAIERWVSVRDGGVESLQAIAELVTGTPSDVTLSEAELNGWSASILRQNKSTGSAYGVDPVMRSRMKWVTYPLIVAALIIGVSVKPVLHMLAGRQATPAMRIAKTGVGETAKIRLADGTVVQLSVASTVRYPADFDNENRTIELDGEAFFEVTQESGAPFTVRTKDADTRVLGTSFGVRRYSSDKAASVTVVSGRVSVAAASAPANSKVLAAGQMANVAGGTVSVSGASLNNLAWLSGRMVFEDVPLSEVLGELERWYGVRFRLTGTTLDSAKVNTEFGSQSLDDVLRVLSSLLDVRAERSGSTITLIPR